MVQPGEGLEGYGIADRDVVYRSEFIQNRVVDLAHLRDQSNGREEDTVIAICKQVLGFGSKVVCNIRDLFNDAESTKSGLDP